MAVLGEQRFGVKLHAFERQALMAHAHDFAVVGPGADVQAFGQAFALDHQAVIARARYRVGQALKHALSMVVHRRHFAVHQRFGAHNMAAKGFADGLMAQANAHNRQLAGKMLNRGHRNAGLARRTGAGAYHQILGLERFDFGRRDVVVAAHQHFLAELGEILHDVVGEAVVIVYHQEHDVLSQNRCAAARGRLKARLYRVLTQY